MSSKWMSRSEVCDYLGITLSALLLLRRDGLVKPDCAACGRMRYLRSDIESNAVDLMKHLLTTYESRLDDLLMPA